MGFDYILIPDHCHSKEGPLYFLPLVYEALVYILCLFLYLKRFYLHVVVFLFFCFCFFFILFSSF